MFFWNIHGNVCSTHNAVVSNKKEILKKHLMNKIVLTLTSASVKCIIPVWFWLWWKFSLKQRHVFPVTLYFHCFNILSYHSVKFAEWNAATHIARAKSHRAMQNQMLWSVCIHYGEQLIRAINFHGSYCEGKLQVSNHAAGLHYYTPKLQIYMLWMHWLLWLPFICSHCFYYREDWFVKDSVTI